MPFITRVTELPPLNELIELEQIVIVDQTGPSVPLGPAAGVVCCIGEFTKGPFVTTEVTSQGQLARVFGGVSATLSQAADGTQDGTAVRFEGNGIIQLGGKSFKRLACQRVDCDAVTSDGGTTKVFLAFSVTIASSDQDPLDATITGRPIVVPAGTRFANTTIGTATKIVALSQDMVIPTGTAIVAGAVSVTAAFINGNGEAGATFYFVKGVSGTSGAGDLIDTVIDSVLPNVNSTIAASGVSTVNSASAASDAWAPGVGASLQVRIETRYALAIDRTSPNSTAAADITVVWAARRGSVAGNIRSPLTASVVEFSNEGRGRIALVSGPKVGTATGDAATVDAAKTAVMDTTTTESPGRVDRKVVCFPYVDVFSSTFQRNIPVSPDGFMAATLSNFPEEKNPGARNPHIQSIQSFEAAFAADPSALGRADYKNMKRKGVACLRRDRSVGWQFQSGVTSVDPLVQQTRAPIKRRRMADFIQDGLAAIAAPYNKEPATEAMVDSWVGDVDTFLSSLANPKNPAAKRVEGYTLDPKSANEPDLQGLGVYILIVNVRLLASLDTLVYQTSIGETVDLTDSE